MHPLLLLAALSSQITFDTVQNGDIYTITPQVTLAQSCVCQVQIRAVRTGNGGQSTSVQRHTVTIPAHQLTALSRLRMTLSPQDNLSITVTVTDGQSLRLSQQWGGTS
ncbi:curli assembly chaperone CsgC [Enterobacter sp.]|uniref:curli assembly chaperone CsgC n=1 Tax=Enterobacter sp. TaxID=42895 RepID=UPI00296F9D3C|nr:curli assembly chaperone CsgC [Enterobacter sp.]